MLEGTRLKRSVSGAYDAPQGLGIGHPQGNTYNTMLEIETGTDFSGMFPYTPSHKYVVGLCRSPRHIPVDAHIVFSD